MDLRVVHLRKVLSVARMLDVPGPPHRLYLSGSEMSAVSAVEINGNRGYAWTQVSEGVIAVELPPVFYVQSVAVLGQDMGSVREAEVFFGYTSVLSMMSGLQKLVQDWLKCFLTSPGSDPFNRPGGGGAQDIFKQATAAEGPFSSALSIAIRRTNEQLIARQAVDVTLPRNEKFLDARLVRIALLPDRTGFLPDIEIVSQTGRRARLGLNTAS